MTIITAIDEIRPANVVIKFKPPMDDRALSHLGDCNFAASTDALSATFQKTSGYVDTLPDRFSWRHAPASFPHIKHRVKHRAGAVRTRGFGALNSSPRS